MNENYPPILSEVTADEILAVLRDMHRQQCTFDPVADPSITLSFDLTVAKWRDACDLLPWAKLADALNRYWSVTIPMDQWRDVLEPANTRSLRGVCELLARHVKLPRIRPANIFGQNCAPAGAFLTIRSYLADAGADVSEIAPSTPLREYTRRYASVFLGPVSQLAPGTLPLVEIRRTPIYDAFIIGMALSGVGIIVGWCGGWTLVGVLSALCSAVCYLGVWTVARRVLPASVEFRGLETFRDLAKAIMASART